ncbi:hypothetical protein L915_03883 [Phytophthora nicotianae]|uniref:Uncharacterized protein n=1 Tax=Phytophthora nicotianae TaxID=4792 RepID=W2HE42_PHYNI|nr:hypothetical protein L915_03883 [Phytophthora nicotianae]ETL46276.1 hypothetical protein L916_03824 [Phytophthora nicotianae]
MAVAVGVAELKEQKRRAASSNPVILGGQLEELYGQPRTG